MTEAQPVTRIKKKNVCFPVLISMLTQVPAKQLTKSSLVQISIEYSSLGGIFNVKFTVPDHCAAV